MSKKKRSAKLAAMHDGRIIAKADREALAPRFRAGQWVATPDGAGRIEKVRIVTRKLGLPDETFVTVVFDGRHRRTYPELEVAKLGER
jgi:hypothetical protein